MEQDASSYRRFLEGDESAFAEILTEFRDPVTFLIQRYVRDICAAEDIAADVFMDLIVHPRRYNFRSSLRTYLFMVARSRAIDWLRHKKRHETVTLEDAESLLADETDLEEQVLKNEQKRRLHAAIAELPEDQQVAVHLVYFEELSYADAARIMKKSTKQIDNLLCRAKASLKSLLSEEVTQDESHK